jgi:hypothetical protein
MPFGSQYAEPYRECGTSRAEKGKTGCVLARDDEQSIDGAATSAPNRS